MAALTTKTHQARVYTYVCERRGKIIEKYTICFPFKKAQCFVLGRVGYTQIDKNRFLYLVCNESNHRALR